MTRTFPVLVWFAGRAQKISQFLCKTFFLDENGDLGERFFAGGQLEGAGWCPIIMTIIGRIYKGKKVLG